MQNTEDISVLRKAYNDDPDNKEKALVLAQHYCDIGWYNEAIEIYRELNERHPGNAAVLLEYGNTVFKKGDYRTAVQIFRQLTSEYPNRIEGWNNLGISLINIKDLEGAFEAFSHILEIEPENPCALVNMGNYSFEKENYEKARHCFEHACNIRPDFADAWFNLGNTLIKLGYLDDAKKAFEKAIRYCREFPSALKNLGWVYEKKGMLDEALKFYSQAVLINKTDANLYINMGNVYAKLRKYDDAKSCFLKAVRLAPNNPHCWLSLRMYAISKGDLETFMRATLAVLPRLTDEMLADSISLLYDMHQFDKAEELLAQADRLGRGGDMLDSQRILLYQSQGKDSRKIQSILERISSLENPPDAVRLRLAQYYLQRKEFEAAREKIEQIKNPDERAFGILWRAKIALGFTKEVKREIREYLKDHPESFDSYFLLADIEGRRGNMKRAGVLLIHSLDNGFNNMDEIHSNEALREIFDSMTAKQLIEEA